MNKSNLICIQNDHFLLTVNESAVAESLIFKPTGEECLVTGECMPLFSLTEERPFNNEVKLAYPNKRMTMNANRLRREGDRLIVGFELVEFEAVIEVCEKPEYITFELVDFIFQPGYFDTLCMTPPPVSEFRLLQLPVKERKRFGEWLNVSWDDQVAVNVLATSPHARIDSEKRKNCRILTADAVRGVRMKHCSAALIVSASDKLLDAIEQLEIDFDLPKGVRSRRLPSMNASIYWTPRINPMTVDQHIAQAKKGGFRKMLIYYTAIFKEESIYALCGNYDFRDEYPNGLSDLKQMLDQIKAAGIIPGIHFLHTHIGRSSRYIAPNADHRLNLTRHFTLSKPLGLEDTVVYVEENPEDSVMHERCRVLKFGGELIYYDNYSTEYPYCFTGCVRGHWNTTVRTHEIGTIGGILDISEYSANSVYVNQHSSLQEEIADKLAEIYHCGFEFIYYDGSEGTNPPYEYHIPNAQYTVYKKLKNEPLFCEGAAKSHFSWHMMAGGNAFDIFPSDVFKEMLIRHPMAEAPRMANDFTQLDFGWWAYYKDAQPDMYEYATSRAASWDCPGTLRASLADFEGNPRHEDVFEVLRRWEDVRQKNWLTNEQKIALHDPVQEHILLVNEDQEYELLPYDAVLPQSGDDRPVKAYIFERKGKVYAVCWHQTGTGKLLLPIQSERLGYVEKLGGPELPIEKTAEGTVIELAGRRYLCFNGSREELVQALVQARLL